jgi:hypothetical protein
MPIEVEAEESQSEMFFSSIERFKLGKFDNLNNFYIKDINNDKEIISKLKNNKLKSIYLTLKSR